MTHGFALESCAGQAAVDGYCKFWVKQYNFKSNNSNYTIILLMQIFAE